MNNRIKFLFILFVFILLLGGAYVLYDNLSGTTNTNQLSTGQGTAEHAEESKKHEIQAPDFMVYDQEGNPVKLSNYAGKPVVLNFWASWCGPCQAEMPHFQDKYLEIGEDVHFLMVNMTDGYRETEKTALEFIKNNRYTFPVLFDKDADASNAYGAYSLPTTFFIDAEGYVKARAIGSMDKETLQRGIDRIFSTLYAYGANRLDSF